MCTWVGNGVPPTITAFSDPLAKRTPEVHKNCSTGCHLTLSRIQFVAHIAAFNISCVIGNRNPEAPETMYSERPRRSKPRLDQWSKEDEQILESCFMAYRSPQAVIDYCEQLMHIPEHRIREKIADIAAKEAAKDTTLSGRYGFASFSLAFPILLCRQSDLPLTTWPLVD